MINNMEDISYIKDQFCKYKCPYKDNKNQISLGKFDHEFDCYDCGEDNEIEIEYITDGLCEYCQVNNFIEDMRSWGIKI